MRGDSTILLPDTSFDRQLSTRFARGTRAEYDSSRALDFLLVEITLRSSHSFHECLLHAFYYRITLTLPREWWGKLEEKEIILITVIHQKERNNTTYLEW